MTYAMSLNNIGFAELTHVEMLCVDGGINWAAVGLFVGGTAFIVGVCVATGGIGAIVAGSYIAGATSIMEGAALSGAGLIAINASTKKI